MAATEGQFDAGVLGAGPGGYVAAIRAAQRGLRSARIDVAGWWRLAGPAPDASGLHRIMVAPADGRVAGSPIALVPPGAAERVLAARHAIIATGSRPKGLRSTPGPTESDYTASDPALLARTGRAQLVGFFHHA